MMTSGVISSPKSQPQTNPKAIALRSQLSANAFLQRYNPDKQTSICSDRKAAVASDSPSLGIVRQAYGDDIAESWLQIQIHDIEEFLGVRAALSIRQRDMLSSILLNEYGYLKVSEFMLFFYRLKCGEYCRFYGNSINPSELISSVKAFLSERSQWLDAIEKGYERTLREATEREFAEIHRRYNEMLERHAATAADVPLCEYLTTGMCDLEPEQLSIVLGLRRFASCVNTILPQLIQIIIRYEITKQ